MKCDFMKKILRIVFVVCSLNILALNPGCKKFDEDPELIHLRTVRHRIEGLKTISQHTIGNTDLNPYWQQRFGDFYIDFTLNNYNSHSSSSGYKLKVYQKGTNDLLCNGEWYFTESDYITFYFNCLDTIQETTWPDRIHGGSGYIIRLSNKEMWLRVDGIQNDLQEGLQVQEVRFTDYEK